MLNALSAEKKTRFIHGLNVKPDAAADIVELSTSFKSIVLGWLWTSITSLIRSIVSFSIFGKIN